MDTHSHDEIDLQDLAVRTIRYFKNHLTFILLLCGVGMGAGTLAYKTLPNTYESQMVVLSDLLTKTYGDHIAKSLSNLIKEENYEELGAKLALQKEKAAAITSITVDCLTDLKTAQRENILKDETYFVVTVELADRSILPDLQEGILHFFRNNELVKTRTFQREALNNAVIKNADKETRLIDSLQRVLFQKGQFKTENLMFDPAELFVASVELTKIRWEAQQDLELASSIHLVEGFTVFQKPKDPKLLTLVILGFVVGLISSIGLLTLKHLINLARS